jgi:hypothetical protein
MPAWSSRQAFLWRRTPYDHGVAVGNRWARRPVIGPWPQLLSRPTSGREVGDSPTARPQKWGWVLQELVLMAPHSWSKNTQLSSIRLMKSVI